MGQRRRRISTGSLALIITAMLITGCTPTSDPATTTTGGGGSTSTTIDSTTTTADPFRSAPLPSDPNVIAGSLDNGLRYFIRFNDAPGERAELRLVVDAGSVNEDHPEQSGTAHFLEHMMFNGTDRFPKNELISVLESFGPRFGPDINASTSFDETIYELTLASDPSLLDLGIDVLREWTTRATITAQDTIEERGVVLEEWRLRDEGLQGRLSQTVQELLLPGTAYEGKAPIGTATAIESMEASTLERFYRDWYRPELMSIVAVGDFDLEDMEARIIEAFSDVSAAEDGRTAPMIDAESDDHLRVAVLADPEVSLTTVEVMWPRPISISQTVGDREDQIAIEATLQMIASRLHDGALRGSLPFLGAVDSSSAMTRGFGVSGISVQVDPNQTTEAIDALAAELARIDQHGFTESEFERLIESATASIDLAYEKRGSNQDAEYAAILVQHALGIGPMLSPEQAFDVDTDIVARLTRTAIEETASTLVARSPTRMVVLGPVDASIPEVDEIEAIIEAIPTLAVAPYADPPRIDTLMDPPEPVEPTSVVVDPDLGFVTAVFPNGATLHLWPTEIAEDVVTIEAASFGGTSLVDVDDVVEAELTAEIVMRSGLGDADAATLQQFLSDRVVDVRPWIGETREGLSALSASDDLEIALQMIHLMMTEPRSNNVAVSNVLAGYMAQDRTRTAVPSVAVFEALDEAYYGDDDRYFTLPTSEQLATFDADRAHDIFRERFENAGDFVFAIVGDIDTAEAIDLGSRYLGSLPGNEVRERYVDHQPLPPREVQLIDVEAGTDPQGELRMYFTNQFVADAKDRLTARVLSFIVNARLRDRIREQLSATYSPFAGIDLQRDPDAYVEASVVVSGDPVRLEEISREVVDDLLDLMDAGPSEAEFATAVEQVRTEISLVDNFELASALVTSFLYPDQPPSDLVTRYTTIDEITRDEVQRLARVTYNDDQRIEIRLVPIS